MSRTIYFHPIKMGNGRLGEGGNKAKSNFPEQCNRIASLREIYDVIGNHLFQAIRINFG